MLNANKVTEYIKEQLGFPFQPLEMEDDKILDYVQKYTLAEFSQYMPYVKKAPLDLVNKTTLVPGSQNEFYLTDDEDLEILNVKDIYLNRSIQDYMFSQPAQGAYSLDDVKRFALDTEIAGIIRRFSDYDITIEFKHPNILRISPVMEYSGYATVEYETIQPKDFSGIPNDLQHTFLELALADIMIVIGRIRKRFGDGNLRTPFGDIPLSSEVLDEGKEKKREILEKLERNAMPNIIMDVG